MQLGLRTVRIAGAFASACALAACPIFEGINQSYTGPPSGTVDGGAAIDAGCPQECGVHATGTWMLVAFGAGATACPGGFKELGAVEAAPSSSCACGACAIGTDPSCESGSLLSTRSPEGGTQCSVSSAAYSANAGCTASIDVYDKIALTGPAAFGGSCAASPLDAATAPAAVCASTSTTCETQACSAALGAGFQACLYSPGDMPCPTPTTVKHTVGSGVTTVCACRCTVDLSSVTCAGQLSIYTSTSCSGSPVVVLPVDGTCNPMTGVMPNNGYTYTASAAGSASCSAVASGGGTVCCLPP